MKVSELIAYLQTQPQEIEVAFDVYSEHRLLETKDIHLEKACEPRNDGWVANYRPDKPSLVYLMFPGN